MLEEDIPMTKKRPLSKSEIFYIENFYDKSELKQLCKDLDRAQAIVGKYVEECKANEEKKPTVLAEQFAHNKGSTVMTPNASEFADSLRGKMESTTRSKNCTTSIK